MLKKIHSRDESYKGSFWEQFHLLILKIFRKSFQLQSFCLDDNFTIMRCVLSRLTHDRLKLLTKILLSIITKGFLLSIYSFFDKWIFPIGIIFFH